MKFLCNFVILSLICLISFVQKNKTVCIIQSTHTKNHAPILNAMYTSTLQGGSIDKQRSANWLKSTFLGRNSTTLEATVVAYLNRKNLINQSNEFINNEQQEF